jgi:hypothetical protein
MTKFFPGGGKTLYDLLTCSKTLVTFTDAEGAALHDAPLASQRRNEVMFDWLEKTCKIQWLNAEPPTPVHGQ